MGDEPKVIYRWSEIFSPPLRRDLEPIMEELRVLIPPWVYDFFVIASADLECAAQIEVSYPYRKVTLTVCLNVSMDMKPLRQIILHEFAHLYTGWSENVIADCVDKFFPDGETPGTKIAKTMAGNACEGATCDLAILLQQLLDSRATLSP